MPAPAAILDDAPRDVKQSHCQQHNRSGGRAAFIHREMLSAYSRNKKTAKTRRREDANHEATQLVTFES
jgi:hypothetical protein